MNEIGFVQQENWVLAWRWLPL